METLREKVADIIDEFCPGNDTRPNAAADRILALPEIAEALAVMRTAQGKETAEYLRMTTASIKVRDD
ncbi:MAG: hypothetical protein JWR80_9508 [Bradyrhizobium sp.]|nr:hypothetical protein [Bradyrhizobium sp.]